MKKLRSFLDSITMYKVVLYSLDFLVVSALIMSATGVLNYASFGVLLGTLGLILTVAFLSNQILSRLYKVTPNFESSLITSFILFFVLGAPSNDAEWIGIGLATAIAIASKYVVTWRSAHIFNPAAFGVLLISLIGVGSGTWWIANEAMFGPMLFVAAIVLLKLRRYMVFTAFLASSLLLILATDSSGISTSSLLWTAVTLYPLLFLGSIMLTEPSTMPNTRTMALLFAAIVGVTYGAKVGFGPFEASPHLSLLLGNIFAFAVSARAAGTLTLVRKAQLTPTTYEFAFQPSLPLPHRPGQYMEFTLPGVKIDSRSNRRTFSIASGPADPLIKIGVKFYENGSAFKKRLASLKVGDTLSGSHVAGDFTLPEDTSIPLVFVAGGIGITPFVAMIADMIEHDVQRTVTLYYFVADEAEIAYAELLKTASKVGVTVHRKVGREARLNDADIAQHPSAQYYLSGPPGMVAAYKSQLKAYGVKHIHTDLFTGY